MTEWGQDLNTVLETWTEPQLQIMIDAWVRKIEREQKAQEEANKSSESEDSRW